MAHPVRAFLVGASPDATVEHTRLILGRMRANPEKDLFVGVDGGMKIWLEAGYKPHMAVGDWDSFKGSAARKVISSMHHLTLPIDKDRSDFYYAAGTMQSAGATHLYCLGVTAGRPDQHLASILDLTQLAAGEAGPFSEVAAFGPEGEYHFLSNRIPKWKDHFPRPRTVSIFAVGGVARGVTLKGLKYGLKGGELSPSSHGLSNRSWAHHCEVGVKKGNLVVMLPSG